MGFLKDLDIRLKLFLTICAVIGALTGGYNFLKGKVATASELESVVAQMKVHELTSEQSFLEMQMYTLEDRIESAKDKNNLDTVTKLEKRLKRLMARQEILDKIRLEKEFGDDSD